MINFLINKIYATLNASKEGEIYSALSTLDRNYKRWNHRYTLHGDVVCDYASLQTFLSKSLLAQGFGVDITVEPPYINGHVLIIHFKSDKGCITRHISHYDIGRLKSIVEGSTNVIDINEVRYINDINRKLADETWKIGVNDYIQESGKK